MTAFLVFTETEPILVMASQSAVAGGQLEERLAHMGFDRFIAHEVPVATLRERYGLSLEVLEQDIRNGKPVRILDSNGRHAFANVELAELGPAWQHDRRGSAPLQ